MAENLTNFTLFLTKYISCLHYYLISLMFLISSGLILLPLTDNPVFRIAFFVVSIAAFGYSFTRSLRKSNEALELVKEIQKQHDE